MEKLGKETIGFNQPVRVRFEDGQEIDVVILEQKPKKIVQDLSNRDGICYWCSQNSPIAKAIIGKSLNETVEYNVSGNLQKVTILGITD